MLVQPGLEPWNFSHDSLVRIQLTQPGPCNDGLVVALSVFLISCLFSEQSGEINYDGDPLLDFTLMRYNIIFFCRLRKERHIAQKIHEVSLFSRFLDRFVYKNPKQKERGNICHEYSNILS